MPETNYKSNFKSVEPINSKLENTACGFSIDENSHSFQEDEPSELGDSTRVERKLKTLWAEYIQCQEKFENETASALKEKYFRLYRRYREHEKWKQLITSN